MTQNNAHCEDVTVRLCLAWSPVLQYILMYSFYVFTLLLWYLMPFSKADYENGRYKTKLNTGVTLFY